MSHWENGDGLLKNLGAISSKEDLIEGSGTDEDLQQGLAMFLSSLGEEIKTINRKNDVSTQTEDWEDWMYYFYGGLIFLLVLFFIVILILLTRRKQQINIA